MNLAETNPAQTFERHERKIILLLCLLAVFHVLLFSAAFPFFNNVDEQEHFDLVVKYSHGHVARGLEPFAPEAIPYLVIYTSPEYLSSSPREQAEVPPWKLPVEKNIVLLAQMKAYWEAGVNPESSQAPLYYFVAGTWWRVFGALGLHDGELLYLLRFFSAIIIVLLVWLGWFTAKNVFPENNFIRVAVPALIAFIPQGAFYSINNDLFSPPAFGLMFLLLLKFWEVELPTRRLAAATGLAIAAAFLSKMSNLPLVAVAVAFLGFKFFRLVVARRLKCSSSSLVVLLLCAGVPVVAWMVWCKVHFGDFTGSNLKILQLGWAEKPFAAWFHHPIFSARGSWVFISRNLATFWQGEFVWHDKPLAFPGMNLFYPVLTLLLLAFAFAFSFRRGNFSAPQRVAVGLAFTCLVSVFAFSALLSVKYDFQNCVYPSRAHPFFTSGRLMLGMLIPFLLLFVCGLDGVLKKFSLTLKFAVLTALLLFMLVSEIAVDWPVFASPYNWFHL